MQCVIEDDGVGRKMANLFKNDFPGHKSRGISIVKERLRIINNITKNYYLVLIEDIYPMQDETGTRVTLDLPIRATLHHI